MTFRCFRNMYDVKGRSERGLYDGGEPRNDEVLRPLGAALS